MRDSKDNKKAGKSAFMYRRQPFGGENSEILAVETQLWIRVITGCPYPELRLLRALNHVFYSIGNLFFGTSGTGSHGWHCINSVDSVID